jgi:hypothetical protein
MLEQLWRSDTIYVSALSMLGRSHGHKFLEKVLEHAVNFIRSAPEGVSFELDPMGEYMPHVNNTAAIENVKRLTTSVLKYMLDNANKVPA